MSGDPHNALYMVWGEKIGVLRLNRILLSRALVFSLLVCEGDPWLSDPK